MTRYGLLVAFLAGVGLCVVRPSWESVTVLGLLLFAALCDAVLAWRARGADAAFRARMTSMELRAEALEAECRRRLASVETINSRHGEKLDALHASPAQRKAPPL